MENSHRNTTVLCLEGAYFLPRNFLLIYSLTFFDVSLGMASLNSAEDLNTGVMPVYKFQQDLQNRHVYLDAHSLERDLVHLHSDSSWFCDVGMDIPVKGRPLAGV